MSEFWQTILGILGSIGFGGAIIAALSSWLGKVWAEKLMAKETAKYEKELECLAKQLERKNYVSKVRFDTEFAIYRELSHSFFDAVLAQISVFPPTQISGIIVNRVSNIKMNSEDYEFFIKAYKHAADLLHRNAPFIPEKIYEHFDTILNNLNTQLILYPTLFNKDMIIIVDKERNNIMDFLKRGKDINEKKEELFCELRLYLKTLDVIDEKI